MTIQIRYKDSYVLYNDFMKKYINLTAFQTTENLMTQPFSRTIENYKKIKVLGKGSFGKAFLVQAESDNSFAVIKRIDITKMSEEEKRDTIKEAKILEVLNHPNIIRFREVYKTKKGQLCIVMDYADGGDLSKLIQK